MWLVDMVARRYGFVDYCFLDTPLILIIITNDALIWTAVILSAGLPTSSISLISLLSWSRTLDNSMRGGVRINDISLVRYYEGTSQYSSGNNVNAESPSSITNRTEVTRNDRLPGAVVLARERLRQKMRGVSVGSI